MHDDEQRIARIKKATLGWEDHGILTCWLHLDYGNAGQGAGGYALDAYHEDIRERVGTAWGMEFVARLMRACGVDEWSKLEGRTVFAIVRDGMVRGIAPLPTEKGDAFDFQMYAEVGAA